MSEHVIELDNDLKLAYIRAIHKIWPALSHYSANDVTEEVVGHMNTVLNEIAQCSDRMALVHELYEDFYMPFNLNKWRKILKEAIDVFYDWIDALEENRQYRTCVVTAAVRWRSTVEMALMGI